MAFSFPNYGSASTTSNVAGGLACSWVNGAPTNGQLLFAFVASNDGTDTAVPPTGWTPLFNYGNTGTSNYMLWACFYKVASSEATSLTFSLSGGASGKHLAIVLLAVGGSVATATPQFVQNYGTSNTGTTGTQTPANANSLVINAFTANQNITALSQSSSPANTIQAQVYDGSGSALGIMVETQNATQTSTTAATSSTATGTVSTLNTAQIVVQQAAAYVTLTDTGPSLSDSIATSVNIANPSISDTGPSISDSVAIRAGIPISITDTGPSVSDSFVSAIQANAVLADTGPTKSDSFSLQPAATETFSDTGPALSDSFALTLGIALGLVDTGPSISDSFTLVAFFYQPDTGNAANPMGMIGNGQSNSGVVGNGPGGHLEGG